MADKKVTIVRLCKTEDGTWKRYPVVMGKTGKIKPNFVWVGKTRTSPGEQVEYPEGRYQIRRYEHGKTIFKDVGAFTDVALHEQKKAIHANNAKAEARLGGVKLVEEESGRVPLRSAYAAWIKAVKSRGSMVQAAKYEAQIPEFIDATGKHYVDELTREDVEDHQSRLRKSGMLSERTIYNKHMNVTSFYKGLGFNTAKMLEKTAPRFEEKMPEAYSEEELRSFFAALPEGRLRMGFQILLMCGLRKREFTNLEWSSVDLKVGVLRVRANKRTGFMPKDWEQRELTIPDVLLERMRLYRKRKANDVLVYQTCSNDPYEGMLKACKKYSDLAGLACGQCHGCHGTAVRCGHWFLHKFRATYITRLCATDMPLRDIMMLSGHKQLKNILRYMAPARSERVRAQVNAVKWM